MAINGVKKYAQALFNGSLMAINGERA